MFESLLIEIKHRFVWIRIGTEALTLVEKTLETTATLLPYLGYSFVSK
jgi:hypothetical protein